MSTFIVKRILPKKGFTVGAHFHLHYALLALITASLFHYKYCNSPILSSICPPEE